MKLKLELNLSPKGFNNEKDFKMLNELIEVRENVLNDREANGCGFKAERICKQIDRFFSVENGKENDLDLDLDHICNILNNDMDEIFIYIINHRNESDFNKYLFDEYIVKTLLSF